MPDRPKKSPAKRASGGASKSAREPLSLERVLGAALVIADREGLDALSMRNLASALGVEAMSLYHHVANKEEILTGLVDLVAGELEVPVIGGAWRAQMKRRARSAHAVLVKHRWATMLFVSRPNVGPNMLRYVNATLGCLVEAGFSYPMADHAWQVIDGHVYGFTLQKLNFPFEPDQYAAMAKQYIASTPMGPYPFLHELARHVADHRHDGLQDFDFGLDMILDGLEKELAKQKKKR
jgi:AcrR family transcriptional regulator